MAKLLDWHTWVAGCWLLTCTHLRFGMAVPSPLFVFSKLQSPLSNGCSNRDLRLHEEQHHYHVATSLKVTTNEFETQGSTAARSIVRQLVESDKCFTTESGAKTFGDVCAVNVVYEDAYEGQPLVGREQVVQHLTARAQKRCSRGGKEEIGFRMDKISDGDQACGFAWTWTVGDEEGLRGTTYVELNDKKDEIVYVREIPEPLFKPGDVILDLFRVVTKDAPSRPLPVYKVRTPTLANDVARYIFDEVQASSVDEAMRFFDESVIYHDFNYKDADILRGKEQVRKFVEDFSLPGIDFVPQRFDDGVDATCFTWEVSVMDDPNTVKGISFYELNPETRLIQYVRDIPESAMKPPTFGKLARDLRPALGVFLPTKVGSRPPL